MECVLSGESRRPLSDPMASPIFLGSRKERLPASLDCILGKAPDADNSGIASARSARFVLGDDPAGLKRGVPEVFCHCSRCLLRRRLKRKDTRDPIKTNPTTAAVMAATANPATDPGFTHPPSVAADADAVAVVVEVIVCVDGGVDVARVRVSCIVAVWTGPRSVEIASKIEAVTVAVGEATETS